MFLMHLRSFHNSKHLFEKIQNLKIQKRNLKKKKTQKHVNLDAFRPLTHLLHGS
jgi:hypothetical protein